MTMAGAPEKTASPAHDAPVGGSPTDASPPRAWDAGELAEPPRIDLRSWLVLLGPGVLLAGTAVGTGEWLLGPAVTAQYGATILWLATLSIVCQVFFNVEVIRYAMFCGEPIHVGFMRTSPGPRFWVPFYLILDLAAVWPLNSVAAATPIAAALLGRLPGDGDVEILGWAMTEADFVRRLSVLVFLAALIPLVFGGAVYRILERIMAFKLVVVLGFFIFVSLLMVAPRNRVAAFTGLWRFGEVPLRPEALVAGRHFWMADLQDGVRCRVRGSFRDGTPEVVGFSVDEAGRTRDYTDLASVPPALRERREQLAAEAARLAVPAGFYVRSTHGPERITLRGKAAADGAWELGQAETTAPDGTAKTYASLAEMPPPLAARCRNMLEHHGNEDVNLLGYLWRQGRFPELEWTVLAAFAAYAGAGGMANTLFSNFARDKGWGMGSKVGAIPSMVGGQAVTLSHVGMAFRPDGRSLPRWRGWMRWALRDQACVWMLCSLAGMAFPCMLSLEFVRHAPVAGHRVSAMMADGMAFRFPDYERLWWYVTLLIGFLVVFPGQVAAGDSIARRWTDIGWSTSRRLQRMPKDRVRYVYYAILAAYAAWGLFVLLRFQPLLIITISGVIGNAALGIAAVHTLWANRRLLPREIGPGLAAQAGLLACAAFFLTISGIVVWHTRLFS